MGFHRKRELTMLHCHPATRVPFAAVCMSLVLLAACGGGDDMAPAVEAKDAPSRHEAAAASWTECAVENGVCALTMTASFIVLYGPDSDALNATTRWFAGGTDVSCTNAVFGDPAFGVVKRCFYQVAPGQQQAWSECAVENGVCALPPTAAWIVLYGPDPAAANVATRWIAGGTDVPCSNAVFGDPAWGVVKRCFYQVAL